MVNAQTLAAAQMDLIRSALAQGAMELRLQLRNSLHEGYAGLAQFYAREIVRNERAQHYAWGLDWPCDDGAPAFTAETRTRIGNTPEVGTDDDDATIDDVEKGGC
jgi:hypothetical protein